MNSSRFASSLVLAVGVIFAVVGARAQTVLDGPGMPSNPQMSELTTTFVAGKVHMITTGGGNLGIFAGKDGVFMVDDRFAALTDNIRNAVTAISAAPVRFLINTHFHGDHTGGNELFGQAGVTIVAHDNVRKTLSKVQFIEAIQTHFAAYKPIGLPIITFSRDMTFHLNGEEVFAFHAPNAHTDGDTIVYFRGSDVIATGDVYQRLGFPVWDRSNGGTFQGLIAGWDRVLSMIGDQTKIIQGHGPVSNKAELQKIRDHMAGVRDFIKTAIAAGKSMETVVAAKPTDAFDDHWKTRPLSADGIVAWAYAELAQ